MQEKASIDLLVVAHPEQAETPRRSRGPGGAPIPACEQVCHMALGLNAATNFDHRADQNADHVAQEAISFNFKDEFGPLSGPGAVDYLTVQALGDWILFAEGAKGVVAEEQAGGGNHRSEGKS